MDGTLILDIILILGGGLALIGLGGAVALSRDNRKHDVRITVEQDYGKSQTVTLPKDSEVVKQLNNVAGIDITTVSKTTPSPPDHNNRRREIAGLGVGVVATLGAVLPFVAVSEIGLAIASSVGALLLTSLGVVLTRIKAQFTGEE